MTRDEGLRRTIAALEARVRLLERQRDRQRARKDAAEWRALELERDVVRERARADRLEVGLVEVRSILGGVDA